MPKLKTFVMGKRQQVDMTEGNIYHHIIFFSMPFLFGQLFQQMYNMVDTWVVGNYVSNEAFAAVGSVGSVTAFIVGFFTGLSGGCSVVIAQYFGAKRYDMVSKATHTFLCLTLFLSVVFTFFGLLVTPFILNNVLKLDANVAAEASTYLRIYFLGITGLLIYNTGAGILRAVGNSRLPFFFLVLSSIVNVVLDLALVLVFDMGVSGVAFATIAAQAASAVAVIFILFRIDAPVRLSLSELRVDFELLRKMIRIGIPTSLQNSITAFCNIFIRSYIFAFGTDCVSGWTVYTKLYAIPNALAAAFALAVNTFTAQNLGKGNIKRAKKGIRIGFILCILCILTCSALIVIFAPQLTRFFNKKPEVVEFGTSFLRMLFPFFFMFAIHTVLSAAMRGAGNSRTPMIIMLSSMVAFRQIYLFVMTKFVSNTLPVIAIAFPAGWFIGAILTIACYIKMDFSKHQLISESERHS